MKRNIYIFGAHSRAQSLAAYLRYLYSDTEIEAYLYDNEESNPDEIDQIPVIYLDKNVKLHTSYPVYIGTRGIYHDRITEELKTVGFKEIYPVTVDFDLKLRNEYLRKYYSRIGWDFLKMEELKAGESTVYVVKSAFDKVLHQEYELAPYEKIIQAGAALTEERLYQGVLTDCIGDSISIKNKQYCELTALYWLWKHAEEDIVGMVHYRRHFTLPDNWQQLMIENEVDVILPIPLYVAPSVAENYKKRHDSREWDFMMQYLKEQDSCTHQMAKTFFDGNLYSPCNMFIMRREVLDGLCGWMFPILNAVVEYTGEKEDRYLNRYPGFLSERLMTFYFEKNRDRYKIVYADKNFLM